MLQKMLNIPSIRRNVLPKNLVDLSQMLCIMLLIPITFWYEIFVVFRWSFEQQPVLYYLHIVIGVFELHNIFGNYLALLWCDTSVLPQLTANNIKEVCTICEYWKPPRARHCSICQQCILRKNHHCTFIGYCIGHRNYRYFFMLLFHGIAAALYCVPYNYYFISQHLVLNDFKDYVALIVPLMVYIIEQNDVLVWYLITSCNFLLLILMLILLVSHGKTCLIDGLTVSELKVRDSIKRYGGADKKRNFVNIFGLNWTKVWMCPFIKSNLPLDGYDWKK